MCTERQNFILRIFTIQNCEKKRRLDHHLLQLRTANLLRYAEKAMESDSYSHDSDTNEENVVFGESETMRF